MKIGFLIANYNNGGGTERVTSVLANELSNRGYKISIISFTDGLNPTYQTNKNISLYSIYNEQKHGIMKKFHNLRALHKIVKISQIDILIVVDVRLYIYAHWIKYINHCKIISWEQFNYYRPTDKLGKISQYLAARYSDYLVTLSKNDLINYQKNVKKLVPATYIYNPVTINENGITDLDNKKIIAVGRLEEEKGFDLLIKSWSKLENLFPDWKLEIFGKGTRKDELLNLISELDLKNIKLRGYSNNIEDEYKKASFFVLSSRYEGFGLVLTEAQMYGLPCISYDITGPNEIVEDNVNGFLVDRFDIDEFAKKMSELMCDPEKLTVFSQNARKNIYRYELNSIVKKWEKVFKDISEIKE
ncbi:glycosyltransferase family 4 protein [Ligilactobacillus cholophilus]|uniref:glycosyltransferase family 4 protein n=1 Tax=Ligilactobacillus cholophilus TaxID=3050131 RepID=UPI0025B24290|nr:glycosyltransferase family 4 protein [Ligilactobacillus cholophilus]